MRAILFILILAVVALIILGERLRHHADQVGERSRRRCEPTASARPAARLRRSTSKTGTVTSVRATDVTVPVPQVNVTPPNQQNQQNQQPPPKHHHGALARAS